MSDIWNTVGNSLLGGLLPNELAENYEGTAFSLNAQKVTKKFFE
jgi:hypothetical protein